MFCVLLRYLIPINFGVLGSIFGITYTSSYNVLNVDEGLLGFYHKSTMQLYYVLIDIVLVPFVMQLIRP